MLAGVCNTPHRAVLMTNTMLPCPHLAHCALRRQAKLDIQLMCELDSKLQQTDIKELQLTIEGQGMPINVPLVHCCLKRLHMALCIYFIHFPVLG